MGETSAAQALPSLPMAARADPALVNFAVRSNNDNATAQPTEPLLASQGPHSAKDKLQLASTTVGARGRGHYALTKVEREAPRTGLCPGVHLPRLMPARVSAGGKSSISSCLF